MIKISKNFQKLKNKQVIKITIVILIIEKNKWIDLWHRNKKKNQQRYKLYYTRNINKEKSLKQIT